MICTRHAFMYWNAGFWLQVCCVISRSQVKNLRWLKLVQVTFLQFACRSQACQSTKSAFQTVPYRRWDHVVFAFYIHWGTIVADVSLNQKLHMLIFNSSFTRTSSLQISCPLEMLIDAQLLSHHRWALQWRNRFFQLKSSAWFLCEHSLQVAGCRKVTKCFTFFSWVTQRKTFHGHSYYWSDMVSEFSVFHCYLISQ